MNSKNFKKMTNLLRKIKKSIWLLINSKFIFTTPTESEILIFDEVQSEKIKKILNSKSLFILHKRGEKFYVPILLKMLLKLKLNMRDYCNHIIKEVNPKVIISCQDNDKLLYLLYKPSGCIKVVLQNAWRSKLFDIFLSDLTTSEIKNFLVDYIFVFNANIGQKYKQIPNSKIISIGSFKSNNVKIYKKNKNKNLVFISNWGNTASKKLDEIFCGNFKVKDFLSRQLDIFNSLTDYAFQHKLNVMVLCKSSMKKNILLEKNFFMSNKMQNIKFN